MEGLVKVVLCIGRFWRNKLLKAFESFFKAFESFFSKLLKAFESFFSKLLKAFESFELFFLYFFQLFNLNQLYPKLQKVHQGSQECKRWQKVCKRCSSNL